MLLGIDSKGEFIVNILYVSFRVFVDRRYLDFIFNNIIVCNDCYFL